MNIPLQIAICEDTPADADKLLSIIGKEDIPTHCTVFQSAEDFLAVFQPGVYDLLLSDIYMGGMTGVEAVTKVRQVDEDLPVAFITTSTDHTLESYRLSALRYIEKPYKEKAVADILKLAQMEKQNAPSLTVERNRQNEQIRFSQIQYLEQQGRFLSITLSYGEKIQIYEKLSALANQLDAVGFYSPHKSYAVNMAFVRSIDRDLRCFVMKDGKNIPIRRESMANARQTLQEYLFNQSRGNSHE